MNCTVHTSLCYCFKQYSSCLSDEITVLEWMDFFTLLLKTISVWASDFLEKDIMGIGYWSHHLDHLCKRFPKEWLFPYFPQLHFWKSPTAFFFLNKPDQTAWRGFCHLYIYSSIEIFYLLWRKNSEAAQWSAEQTGTDLKMDIQVQTFQTQKINQDDHSPKTLENLKLMKTRIS